MADQPRTQKQIAQKYKDNLDYYRRGHFLRRLKLICFLLAIFGSLGAVFGFRFWGTREYFNTGPISQNHARFSKDCTVCHQKAEVDLSRALKLDQAIVDLKEGNVPHVDFDELKKSVKEAGKNFSAAELAAAAQRNFSPEKFSALQQAVIKKSSLAGMDAACLRCHKPFQLHQPQMEALKLRGVHPQMPLVHSDRCSTCHREHVGAGLMHVPGSETCAGCHADLKELLRTRNVIKVNSPSPPDNPANRDLGDGLLRFIMPQEREPHFDVIKNYADGHPAFRYEGANARDPAVIKFNHARHEETIVRKADGSALQCADCHQPKDGGAYYEPVKYAKHCAECHALKVVQKDLPGFTIPHGDPTVVHVFVKTIFQQLSTFLFNQNPAASDKEVGDRAADVERDIINRGIRDRPTFKRRIFETGDPPPDIGASPKPTTSQTFPPCAKCHEVTPSDTLAGYKITPTNIADRWVHHGPFTHLPHTHMSCNDCHGAADEEHNRVHQSSRTTDVLMPPQRICAECHRPLQKAKVKEIVGSGVAPKPGSSDKAAKERREGGVKWECQNCHQFHAPADSIEMVEASAK